MDDVDFGPSTTGMNAGSDQHTTHPLAWSSDGGATLHWGKEEEGHGKKWGFAKHKGKGREPDSKQLATLDNLYKGTSPTPLLLPLVVTHTSNVQTNSAKSTPSPPLPPTPKPP